MSSGSIRVRLGKLPDVPPVDVLGSVDGCSSRSGKKLLLCKDNQVERARVTTNPGHAMFLSTAVSTCFPHSKC